MHPSNSNKSESRPNAHDGDKESVLKQYASKSTMHGIGHLTSGQGLRHKIYWCILVLFGLSMATIHLRFHVKNYMESPVSTEIQHETDDFLFPDVTFCSLTPTTGRMYRRLNQLNRHGNTVNDYILAGALYTIPYMLGNVMNYTEDLRFHREWIYRQRYTYSSYNRSFYPSSEMIFSCRYQGRDCRDDFKIVNDPYYWNCYTFQPKRRIVTTTNPEDGLMVIAYTATEDITELTDRKFNMMKVQNTFFNLSNITSLIASHNTGWNFYARVLQNSFEPAGVKIVIHEGETNAHAKDQGFVLKNGEYAKIALEMYGENRLKRPGKECSEEPATNVYQQGVHSNGSLWVRKMILTEADCDLNARQDRILATCGCRSHFLPVLALPDAPMCYNYSQYLQELEHAVEEPSIPVLSGEWPINYEDVMKLMEYGRAITEGNDKASRLTRAFKERLECHNRVLSIWNWTQSDSGETFKPHDASSGTCVVGCKSSVYKYYLSSAPWPRDSDFLPLMRDTILPSIKNTDGTFKKIAEDFIQRGNVSADWNSSTEVIKRNFVRVVVHPMKLKSNVHVEKYSYDFLEVLSEVGGIMGLYLGMSILTFFELVDIMIDSLCSCCMKPLKKSKKESTQAETELMLPEVSMDLITPVKQTQPRGTQTRTPTRRPSSKSVQSMPTDDIKVVCDCKSKPKSKAARNTCNGSTVKAPKEELHYLSQV